MSNSIEIKNGTTVNLSAPEKSAISLSVPERSITNVTIGGLKAVGRADASFEYTQNQSSKVWEINHNLNKKPSVTLSNKHIVLTVRPGFGLIKRAKVIHNWHKTLLHSFIPMLIKRWEKKLNVKVSNYFLQTQALIHLDKSLFVDLPF